MTITRLHLFAAFAIVFLFPMLAFGQVPSQGTEVQLKVMAYNIHHGRGMDNVVDLERIAKVIRDAAPDLVALQEVDYKTARTNGVDQAAELGRLTGMHHLFLRQIDFEGGEYGQAILSKYPISDSNIHWLPGTPERERRIAAIGKIETPQPILFGSTHLHHAKEEFRNQQAEEINRIAKKSNLPILLLGDFNAYPESQCIAILEKEWHSVTPSSEANSSGSKLWTFPADDPKRQIDYIFGYPKNRWKSESFRAIDEAMASDHRPIVAVVKLQ